MCRSASPPGSAADHPAKVTGVTSRKGKGKREKAKEGEREEKRRRKGGRMDAIKATLDRAGRIAIPRTLREAASLEPGTDVDIRVVSGKVEIVATAVAEGKRKSRLGKRALKSA
jgi:AbrB family looped-hinge helix DNA binding protein